MSSSKAHDGDEADETPRLTFTSPSSGPKHSPEEAATGDHGSQVHRRRFLRRPQQSSEKHGRLGLAQHPRSSASSVYMGSFTPHRSVVSVGGSVKSPGPSAPGTPRTSKAPSMSQVHLESLLQDLNLELETYGVEERRDGFFDASFFKPPRTNHEDLMRDAEHTLPADFHKQHPLSLKSFLPKQWHDIKSAVRRVTTTRAGIKLLKTFLAFFAAYILCLVPVVSKWLGRYNYIFVLSTIINHPGRTVGAQLDGAFLTIVGSATGLAWGAFALWVSDSTTVARRGYGGILTAFLVVFMGGIAALRSYYIRMYQAVLCAGFSVLYTCLADTSEKIAWVKIFNFGIPWLLGQALCLLICCTVFPDAGARPLAVSLHNAFGVIQEGLILPQADYVGIHRKLAWTFVNLSQSYRDLALDVSITRFLPSDVASLRNVMQAVIRSLLSLKMENELFENFKKRQSDWKNDQSGVTLDIPQVGNNSLGEPSRDSLNGPQVSGDAVVNIDNPKKRPSVWRTDSEERAATLVAKKLGGPTTDILSCMRAALQSCDAVLMDMSGYRTYLGPPKTVSSDIFGSLTKLRKAMIKYDEEEDVLLGNPALPPSYSNHPEVVEMFLFVRPVRQAATAVEALLIKVMEMQQRHHGWRLYLPSYPLRKGLQRTNAQVRHDRGGVTAGFYFRSQSQLARTMKGMANVYKPLPRKSHDNGINDDPQSETIRTESMGRYEEEEDVAMDRSGQASKQKLFRYRAWTILHRLQGFETRFALKVAIVTSLLSVPAWLSDSRWWWNQYESWWAVVMVWIMMHPRVGGNFQDLVTRALCGVLGALFGGLAYGADNGNPYVSAVIAAVFMIPMLYRFTQSSHPRSGIVGCVSFVVVSLGAYAVDGQPSIATIAWTRGVAFVVGVVSAVIVNWVLWPFVARHELRKALSAMMIYSSIIYRGVVAKYVYYEEGEPPQKEDIERSEMLEGRLREGFVRIRQLMALTRHEIRLRGPFNPLPYSALIDGSERFFEYLVAVRQSSLFFHPHYISDDEQDAESLLALRRDAVAVILMILYVLAGALRGDRKVPRYLPSAAAARKRLLDHMAAREVEQAQTQPSNPEDGNGRKWSQIYSYSYSQSLTGCVKQLEQLIKYTKEIVGEYGFDPVNDTDYGDLT